MTNKQRQEWFNKKKWLESEKQGVDMSGIMVICDYCDACVGVTCTATQKEIDEKCYCATAYNRLVRERRK